MATRIIAFAKFHDKRSRWLTAAVLKAYCKEKDVEVHDWFSEANLIGALTIHILSCMINGGAIYEVNKDGQDAFSAHMLDFTSAYEQVHGPGGEDKRVENSSAFLEEDPVLMDSVKEKEAALQENVSDFGSWQATVQVQPMFAFAGDKEVLVEGEKRFLYRPLKSQFVFGREPLRPPQRISERMREDAKTYDEHDGSVATITFERKGPVFTFGEDRPPFPRARMEGSDMVETSRLVSDGLVSSSVSVSECALTARPSVGDALGENAQLLGDDGATGKVNASVSCRNGAAVERGSPYILMVPVGKKSVVEEEARVESSDIESQLPMVGPHDSLIIDGHETSTVDSDEHHSG